MRAMKDSGVEWIGEIPAEWEIGRVKNIFIRKNEKAMLENPVVLSLARAGVHIRDISNNEGQIALSYYNYNPVDVGDLLLNPMDLYSGANCSISRVKGVISPAYVNLKGKNNVDARYYDYYFKVQYWQMVFFSYGKGVSFENRWTLTNETLMNFKVLMLSYSEQQRIADYLDKKCAEIDEIISKQHSIIEKLKEYKLSLITETVTKGLNADVEMKDSGIEWIGEIPKHWKIESFRHVLKERNEKNTPVKSKERLSLSIELGVTLYAEKTTNLDRFKDDYEQYKIAHVGDLVMNSMNMIVGASGVSKYYGCVSPAYYTFYDEESDHIKAKFCEYIFRSKTMRRVLFSLGKGIYAIVRGNDRVNTCRLKVSKDDLKNIKIPLPPVTEMRDIIHYIEQKSLKIENIIENKQKLINKLTEYKKSLIYEVVTGKKEV